jgi:hypothetical protein
MNDKKESSYYNSYIFCFSLFFIVFHCFAFSKTRICAAAKYSDCLSGATTMQARDTTFLGREKQRWQIELACHTFFKLCSQKVSSLDFSSSRICIFLSSLSMASPLLLAPRDFFLCFFIVAAALLYVSLRVLCCCKNFFCSLYKRTRRLTFQICI